MNPTVSNPSFNQRAENLERLIQECQNNITTYTEKIRKATTPKLRTLYGQKKAAEETKLRDYMVKSISLQQESRALLRQQQPRSTQAEQTTRSPLPDHKKVEQAVDKFIQNTQTNNPPPAPPQPLPQQVDQPSEPQPADNKLNTNSTKVCWYKKLFNWKILLLVVTVIGTYTAYRKRNALLATMRKMFNLVADSCAYFIPVPKRNSDLERLSPTLTTLPPPALQPSSSIIQPPSTPATITLPSPDPQPSLSVIQPPAPAPVTPPAAHKRHHKKGSSKFLVIAGWPIKF